MYRRFQVIYNTATLKNQEAIVEGVDREAAKQAFFNCFTPDNVTVTEVRSVENDKMQGRIYLGNPPEYMR